MLDMLQRIKDTLNSLKKLKLIHLSLYFVTLFLVYEFSYYRVFNIDIIPFIVISELPAYLVAFIPKLIFIFIYSVFLVYFMFVISKRGMIFNKYLKSKIFRNKKPKKESLKEEKESVKKPLINLIISFLIQFFLFYFLIFENKYTVDPMFSELDNLFSLLGLNWMTSILIILTFTSQLDYIYKLKNLFHHIGIDYNNVKVFFMCISLFFFVGVIAQFEAGIKVLFNSDKKIAFVIKDKVENKYVKIESKDSLVYVGLRNDKVFIFNNKNFTTKIYDLNNLENVIFYNQIMSSNLINFENK